MTTFRPSSDIWAELLQMARAFDDFDEDLDEDFDFDYDRAFDLSHILNDRGEPEVVDWALPKLTSASPGDRWVAATVLGQHGFQRGRPYGDRVAPALAGAARIEEDDDVRFALIHALGLAEDPAWAPELASYADDPDPSVRKAVAGFLPLMFGGDEPDAATIALLIRLSTDEDPHVRDWATMGLGTQSEQDSDAIRSALRARLDDTDDDDSNTSAEAALGLALRHDPSCVDYLARWLFVPTPDVGNLIVEAVGALGDRRFLPWLLELRAAGWQDEDPCPEVLDEAIAALGGPPAPETSSD
ncbi:HEAT repeat domain-containing protein [Nocardioides sp. DS6]|uniref:HEAT repeat domain-containing protein n=1 Tax=Nocardioides eburneus TaxID=3231482 RepID=A0ABV3SZL5_9ACTN